MGWVKLVGWGLVFFLLWSGWLGGVWLVFWGLGFGWVMLVGLGWVGWVRFGGVFFFFFGFGFFFLVGLVGWVYRFKCYKLKCSNKYSK